MSDSRPIRTWLRSGGAEVSIFCTVRRVLVVDDEENLRLVLRTLLRRHGYEVGGVDYFSKPFDPEILIKLELEENAHSKDVAH